MNFPQNNFHVMDRRSVIRGAAKSLLGVSALATLGQFSGQSAFASTRENRLPIATGTAKAVIYIYLTGGLSQIDSFDPKPGMKTQGPVESLSTNADGVLISEYFPRMTKQMDKVCVVRSMNSTQGVHEHGRYYMRTSYMMNQTINHPAIGAWSSHFLGPGNTELPQNIRIGGSTNSSWGGFLDPRHAALTIATPDAGLPHSQLPGQVTSSRFERRLERLRSMNEDFAASNRTRATKTHVELFDEAVRLMKSQDLEGFELSRETPKKRQQYGENTLGQGCLLARRLVERGVRFVEVNDRGWDTHIRNFALMKEKGAVLDQALSTLLEDLSLSGMLDETLVVVATEFGRTPIIDEANVGRDHYPQAFSCLLAGGGIRGGQAHGETDKKGFEIIADRVTVPDFNATIAHALGLPLQEKVISPSNRPFTVANQGEPILSLFG
jgi:hypothetical protein